MPDDIRKELICRGGQYGRFTKYIYIYIYLVSSLLIKQASERPQTE